MAVCMRRIGVRRLSSLASVLIVVAATGAVGAPSTVTQAQTLGARYGAPAAHAGLTRRLPKLGAHVLVSLAQAKAGDEQIVAVTTRAGATVAFSVLYPGGAGMVAQTVPNADPSGAALDWIIPGYVPPGVARVVVTVTLGGQKFVKVSYFTITTPVAGVAPRTIGAHVMVTGTQVMAGTPQTIIVTTRQGATVDINVVYPDGAGTVSTMIPAADSTGVVFTWPIPDSVPAGQAQVEVVLRLGHARGTATTTFDISAGG